MVQVALMGKMRALVGGASHVEVSAKNARELLDAITEKHPELTSIIEEGVSLSIDGLIYKEAWFTPISDDSEVVIMPLMAGG